MLTDTELPYCALVTPFHNDVMTSLFPRYWPLVEWVDADVGGWICVCVGEICRSPEILSQWGSNVEFWMIPVLLAWISSWTNTRVHDDLRYFLHDRPWISPSISLIQNDLNITIPMISSQLSGYCDVISNGLWRHQQNENWASETRGRCVKIFVFIVIYGFVMSYKKSNNVCTPVMNCFCAHLSVILIK